MFEGHAQNMVDAIGGRGHGLSQKGDNLHLGLKLEAKPVYDLLRQFLQTVG